MRYLKDGSRISDISVFPKNWKLKSASVKQDWYIYYRYYFTDKDNKPKSKLIVIKRGVNSLKTAAERKELIEQLLEIEYEKFNLDGYNPVEGTANEVNESIVTPNTPFIKALEFAQSKIKIGDKTSNLIRHVIKYITEAAKHFDIANIELCKVRKVHIKTMFEYLQEKRNWSAHMHNSFRSGMMILYKELAEYDAVEMNIPRELSKQKLIRKVRVILNEEQRAAVRKLLQETNPRFWLFVNMFFHSGARETEFCRLQIKDINLDKQTAKFLVKKGKYWKEEIKPIKDIAVKYWEQYLDGYTNGELYVIGKGLYPQPDKGIRAEQITRRWRTWIKKSKKLTQELGVPIDADFYSLKHLNSDEISDKLSIQDAARLNSQKSTETTKIYAINESTRQAERIRKVNNEF